MIVGEIQLRNKRYAQFILRAVNGEETIHSGTLYPYDIVEKLLSRSGSIFYRTTSLPEDETLEAQWRQLPNYVPDGASALVIADTSGSMCGRPLATSVGLAVYFAERNKGPYHNLFMSFSSCSSFQTLKGETLAQKISSIDMDAWGGSTNLHAAFVNILNVALKNHVSPEDMPKSLIVISDMEIDFCGDRDWTFYDNMSQMFRQSGYEIPNVIFWNVDSRHDVFHVDKSRIGVQLASGQSAAVFKQVMDSIGMTPVEAMERIINSERYAPIAVS